MKAIIGSTLLCMGLLSASAEAQAVYKCVVGGAVTFQQIPCEPPPALIPRSGAPSVNAPLLGTWHSDHDLTMT